MCQPLTSFAGLPRTKTISLSCLIRWCLRETWEKKSYSNYPDEWTRQKEAKPPNCQACWQPTALYTGWAGSHQHHVTPAMRQLKKGMRSINTQQLAHVPHQEPTLTSLGYASNWIWKAKSFLVYPSGRNKICFLCLVLFSSHAIRIPCV